MTTLAASESHRGQRHSLPATVVGLVGVLLVSAGCAISLGTADVGLTDTVRYIGAGVTGGWIDADERGSYQVVWQVRLPRVLLAIIVGAGLGLVGVASQALVRNALADPYVLGVSSGASVGAAAVLVFGVFTALGVYALSAAAFLGALVASAVVYSAARSSHGMTPLRLVLIGTVMAHGFSAITTLLVFLAPRGEAARSALFWLLGGLGGVTWPSLPVAACVVFAGCAYLLAHARQLNALAMGDETAATLGVEPARLRKQLFAVCAAMTGCLVAVSGAVGFVGLIVPHLVRMVCGADHRRVLVLAPLVGGVLMVWMDLLARTVVAPRELPLGVLTAAVGVPIFVFLIRRRGYVFGGR